jgi:hypothetical protein
MRTILVLLLTVCLAGCNVFEPFHTPGSSKNVDDLLSDAHDSLDKKDYRKALKIMDKAMTIAPDDPRVRYLHAVATVRAYDVDMLDVLDILQPADKDYPVDTAGKRVLLMTNAELENMFDAFQIVSEDLEPIMTAILNSGAELRNVRESEDIFLSYGVSETLLGMLRVLDNDDTDHEFSLDERIIITKTPDAFELTVEDILITLAERDQIIDAAIDRSWDWFLRGRHALFCYYQFVANEVIWSEPLAPPPAPLPEAMDDSVTGDMVRFVDDGVMALYYEKEDRGTAGP